MSVNDQVIPGCSDNVFIDANPSTALVEPMEVDEQHHLGTVTGGTETSITTTAGSFESYLTNKSGHSKAVTTVYLTSGFPVSPSQRSGAVATMKTGRPRFVLTSPGEPQPKQLGLLRPGRPPSTSSFPAGSPLSPAKAQPVSRSLIASSTIGRPRVSGSSVVAVAGQSHVGTGQILLSGDSPSSAVQVAGLVMQPSVVSSASTGNRGRPAKGANLQSGKSGRTPSIISRNKAGRKSSQSLAASGMRPITPRTPQGAAVNVFSSPIVQMAATPGVLPALVRSPLVASSSNVVVLNSPTVASHATAVPSVSSFSLDFGGSSGKVLRLAGQRNVCLTRVGTIALPSTSPKLGSTPLRFPSPRLSTPVAAHRFVLTSVMSNTSMAQATVGTSSTAARPLSPLTSFRMQNVKNQAASALLSPGSGLLMSQVKNDPKRLALKRLASFGSSDPQSSEERPPKRRRLVSGRSYHVTLPDGTKKLVGCWEKNMIRSLPGQLGAASAAVGAGGDTTKDATLDEGSIKLGTECNTSCAALDVTEEADDISDSMEDRFYICMKCRTVSSSSAICVSCGEIPLACSRMSQSSIHVASPAKKPATVEPQSQSTPLASAQQVVTTKPVQVVKAMPQQTASPLVATHPKSQQQQRIIVMPSGGSNKIQIMRLPLESPAAGSPSTVRLNLPMKFPGGTTTSGTPANARFPTTARLVRRKVIETQKRAEPDVVQILSSDDEENQTLDPGANTNTAASAAPEATPAAAPEEAPAAAPEVAAAAKVTAPTATEEGQPANSTKAPVMSVVALPKNHLFTIKIRIVRFGTMQRSSVVQSSFYVDGIKVVFSKDVVLGSCSLYIPATDLRVIRVHYGPCGPVLFLHACQGVASKLREILPFHDQCYDPDHKDDACRFITIIPDKNQVVDEKYASSMLEKMRTACPADRRFTLQTINGEIASQLLKAKPSSAFSTQPAAGTTTQTMIFMMPNGQVIQKHVTSGEFFAKPTEGDEEEQVADRSRSPSPPHPTFIGPVVRLFTYPPPPATGGIPVTNEDFFCLKDGEYLNDVIIDFYLKYLLREVMSKEDRDRTHVFSSFFYRRLMQKQAKEHNDSTITLQQLRHSRVRTWTRHVDLFSKDFIIVPINESAHWYLAIICFPGSLEKTAEESETSNSVAANKEGEEATGPESQSDNQQSVATTDGNTNNSFVKKPCILIFDSLLVPTRYGVVRTLREYLQSEWDAKKKSKEGARDFNRETMQGACPRCPRQTNFSDCGVYLLQYVESFFKDPITSFTLPITTLGTWFPEELIVTKRESLRQLVLKLQKDLNPKLDYDPRQNSVDSLTSGSLQIIGLKPNNSVGEATSSESATTVASSTGATSAGDGTALTSEHSNGSAPVSVNNVTVEQSNMQNTITSSISPPSASETLQCSAEEVSCEASNDDAPSALLENSELETRVDHKSKEDNSLASGVLPADCGEAPLPDSTDQTVHQENNATGNSNTLTFAQASGLAKPCSREKSYNSAFASWLLNCKAPTEDDVNEEQGEELGKMQPQEPLQEATVSAQSDAKQHENGPLPASLTERDGLMDCDSNFTPKILSLAPCPDSLAAPCETYASASNSLEQCVDDNEHVSLDEHTDAIESSYSTEEIQVANDS